MIWVTTVSPRKFKNHLWVFSWEIRRGSTENWRTQHLGKEYWAVPHSLWLASESPVKMQQVCSPSLQRSTLSVVVHTEAFKTFRLDAFTVLGKWRSSESARDVHSLQIITDTFTSKNSISGTLMIWTPQRWIEQPLIQMMSYLRKGLMLCLHLLWTHNWAGLLDEGRCHRVRICYT